MSLPLLFGLPQPTVVQCVSFLSSGAASRLARVSRAAGQLVSLGWPLLQRATIALPADGELAHRTLKAAVRTLTAGGERMSSLRHLSLCSGVASDGGGRWEEGRRDQFHLFVAQLLELFRAAPHLTLFSLDPGLGLPEAWLSATGALAAARPAARLEVGGFSALHQAASYWRTREVEKLLSAGWAANLLCGGRPPLAYACHGGSAQVVRLLLQHGADPLLRFSWEEGLLATPFAMAALRSKYAVRTVLEEVSPEVAKACLSSDALHVALYGEGRGIEGVAALLEAGGDPSAVSEQWATRAAFGGTPLAVLAHAGVWTHLGSLLEAGAALPPREHIPDLLMHALRACSGTEDAEARHHTTTSPNAFLRLLAACLMERPGLREEEPTLLAQLVLTAVDSKSDKLARRLVPAILGDDDGRDDAEVRLPALDPSVVTRSGKGILHAAARRGHEQTVEYILRRRLVHNLRATDDHGWTAAEVAFIHGHRRCSELIRQAGGAR